METYGEGERAHRTAFASLKHGYEKACEQPDYYADGDHMVVFRKRLLEPEKKTAASKAHG